MKRIWLRTLRLEAAACSCGEAESGLGVAVGEDRACSCYVMGFCHEWTHVRTDSMQTLEFFDAGRGTVEQTAEDPGLKPVII